MVSIKISNIVFSFSGAGISRRNSSSDLNSEKPFRRVRSTSARYSDIKAVVESSSGNVHSNGSSHNLVVMPPNVCSIFPALRKMYSPHENIWKVLFSSRGCQNNLSSGMSFNNSFERECRRRNCRSKTFINDFIYWERGRKRPPRLREQSNQVSIEFKFEFNRNFIFALSRSLRTLPSALRQKKADAKILT